jgi:DNA-directed RNA polymerase alpha subunit
MGRELDIDPDELKIRVHTDFSVTAYEITIRGSKYGKEWKVVASEDDERELAIEIVKQDLDESPENFNQNFIEQHINMDRLRRDLESDVQSGNEERLRDERPNDFWKEYERAGFDAPEEDEDGEREDPDDSHIEELAQSITDEELKDPMSYLDDLYGKEDAVKKAIEIAGIDIDAAAEDAVDTDGPAHFYDGNSTTTKGRLVYWRTN